MVITTKSLILQIVWISHSIQMETFDDYVFGIRCDHLMWAEGNCEGIEPFWSMRDREYASDDDRDFVLKYKSILVFGNHKGILMTKLIVLHH